MRVTRKPLNRPTQPCAAARLLGHTQTEDYFARASIAEIFTVYALKMAAVFQVSGATLWIRTGVMPRWLALLTYGIAFVFLLGVSRSLWVVMLFPAWVFLVSAYIIVSHVRRRSSNRPAQTG